MRIFSKLYKNNLANIILTTKTIIVLFALEGIFVMAFQDEYKSYAQFRIASIGETFGKIFSNGATGFLYTMIMLGIIIILCDLPNIKDNMILVISRCNRKSWGYSIIASVFSFAIIMALILEVLVIVANLTRIEFDSFYDPESFRLFVTFILMVTAIGLFITCVNLGRNGGAYTIILLVFIFMDRVIYDVLPNNLVGIVDYNGQKMVLKIYDTISPCGQFINSNDSTNFPGALIYFVMLITIFSVVIIRNSKKAYID